MRTPEQVQWDFVQQWLAKARQDLRVAEVLLRGDLEDFENVSFHAQQAVEKFIKALLVRHHIEFPKTHNIAHLRQLVERVDRTLAGDLAPADVLTPYGWSSDTQETLGRCRRPKGPISRGWQSKPVTKSSAT